MEQRYSQLVRRFTATADDGKEFVIEEYGDFLRVQADGVWSQPMRTGGRLLWGRVHVNPTDDPSSFEVLTGLTPVVVRRSQP